VRVPDAESATVLAALDMGAEGVLIPRVSDPAAAALVAQSARYRQGTRGFSNSHRAAGYGRRDLQEYLREADEHTLVIAQIEDRAALARLQELMALRDIDGFFIGRADLMVSLGVASLEAPEVVHAVQAVAAAARAASRPLGLFLPTADPTELARYGALGASLFVIGSDQSLMKEAARQLARAFHAEEDFHGR
jgi:2-keto-3-deoxy-L-rhamnonate aldolase RhmA